MLGRPSGVLAHDFSVVFCPNGSTSGSQFPSAEAPVLDLSVITQDSERGTRVQFLAGLASDGVARVGIRDEAGMVHTARVVGNVYTMTDTSGIHAKAITAFDTGGDEVFFSALPG